MKLTIMGLYNSYPEVMAYMKLPPSLDRDIVVDNILMECAEFELLYPSLNMMKIALKQWSEKELPVWQHLYETTQYDYNPIWNKDGTVTEVESRNLNYIDKDSGTDVNNRNWEKIENDDFTTTSENGVSAYNSDTFQPAENGETHTVGKEGASKEVINLKHGKQTEHIEKENDSYIKHSRTEKGNIGVTSTQQLIREEREIAEFNVIDFIVNSFKRRFCVMVY